MSAADPTSDSAHSSTQTLSALPSVDAVLGKTQVLIATYGRTQTTSAVRAALQTIRDGLRESQPSLQPVTIESICLQAARTLERANAQSLRAVFNLTGTVLHTNLGRAPLPEEAIAAMAQVARGASNLEFDLAIGKRGDRDDHLEDLLARLTGAEAATVVNNNAAAVLLTLNTLGARREVIVSRGELIEIGGAFRIPDIMARAGCKLHEVGTTNRTHKRDFEQAIGPRSAAIMKVHTSNYVVQGFTAEVSECDLAAIAHAAGLPFIADLGAGALVDLQQYGLPHEPTVAETIAQGADVVTFSGDKLLGGPQAGLIAGRRDLIAKIKKNPMKRALRVDKLTIAALEAVLRLHLNPEQLAHRLPAINLLTRDRADIRAVAERILPHATHALAQRATVTIADCTSQIGSGSLPVESLPSTALVFAPHVSKGGKRSGSAAQSLGKDFRNLPIPVIGRIEKDAFHLDLRCLTDTDAFIAQLAHLDAAGPHL